MPPSTPSAPDGPAVPPERTRLRLGLSLLLVATAPLAGCIVVPAGRPQGPPPGRRRDDDDDDDDGYVVEQAPPPPQVDVVIAAPGPGYFWIAGHWAWIGGRHAWIGGRWHAHRPGWRWRPYAWQRHPRGWRGRPGRWERD